MSVFEDFVHISTGPGAVHSAPAESLAWPGSSSVPTDYFDNSKGQREFTQGLIVASITRNHPKYHLTVTNGYNDFIDFAKSQDNIEVSPYGDSTQSLVSRDYILPMRRFGDENGRSFRQTITFGAFNYKFQDTEFLLYVVAGVNGPYTERTNYVLVPNEDDTAKSAASCQTKADDLIAAVAAWQRELHGEILVFDQGWWQKSSELWDNVQKSKWEDVILAKERKDAIINDVIGFFGSQERYAEFGVPWKRGVIFYGPPGNGKTISTKALMHDVSKKVSPSIESLYVKTFNSFQGPEYGIRQIFLMARQMAPCLLIFEDIDSLVNPMVRSYFLNEVDGLESNHGILMIGSTNHLERLDPGIAKRPSRFDRKYFFDEPDKAERIQYAEYWRAKLRNNKKVDFPKELSLRVAEITNGFSFAYMKEAFVAALLVIVAKGDEEHLIARGGGDGLSDNVFWKELKKQIENLRKEMDSEEKDLAGLVTPHLEPPQATEQPSQKQKNSREEQIEPIMNWKQHDKVEGLSRWGQGHWSDEVPRRQNRSQHNEQRTGQRMEMNNVMPRFVGERRVD